MTKSKGPSPPQGAKLRGTLSANRLLSVRVKTANKRSDSSTRWLQRHLNDPYVAESKKQGWRSRAAFKLLQLNEKFKFLRAGQNIVDLGAAPGGWTQVAVQFSQPERGKGYVVGIDLLEMEPVPNATTFQADFNDPATAERLKELLQGKADVVLSDMAADTIGHKQTDHLRIVALAELAAFFAADVLNKDGHFICKLFQGGAQKELLDFLKQHFRVVKHAKPAASRQESSESYVVALEFKGKKEP